MGARSHASLERLSLAFNRVTSKTALVAAHTLSHMMARHGASPPLKVLDLSGNAVSATGARALYRRGLNGLTTRIHLKDCAFSTAAGPVARFFQRRRDSSFFLTFTQRGLTTSLGYVARATRLHFQGRGTLSKWE